MSTGRGGSRRTHSRRLCRCRCLGGSGLRARGGQHLAVLLLELRRLGRRAARHLLARELTQRAERLLGQRGAQLRGGLGPGRRPGPDASPDSSPGPGPGPDIKLGE